MRLAIVPVVSVAFAALVSASCEDSGSSGGRGLVKADSSGASLLAITKPETGAAQPIAGAGFELLKVDAVGVAAPVLDQDALTWTVHPVGGWIVASGIYPTGNGDEICYLIAFPEDSSGDDVVCLATDRVGEYLAEVPDNTAYDQYGIGSRGDTLFFTVPLTSTDPQKSYLSRWVAGSTTSELLVQLDATDGNRMGWPVVHDQADNVCAIAPQINAAPGKAICGAAEGNAWTLLDHPAEYLQDPMIQVGTKLIHPEFSLELSTMVVTSHLGLTQVPSFPKTCELQTGGAVGVNFVGELAAVSTNGSVSLLEGSEPWERLVADGNWCWVYGTNRLQRVARADGTLDPTNWLGTFSLLQVNDFSLTTEGLVRIDGVDSSGGPTIVYVDSSSGELTASPVELERMQQVFPL